MPVHTKLLNKLIFDLALASVTIILIALLLSISWDDNHRLPYVRLLALGRASRHFHSSTLIIP